MNRRVFTENSSLLLLEMVDAGDMPVEDSCMRSTEEQQRLFKLKLTKCDGVIKVSKHQQGLAKDIYFCITDKNDNTKVDYVCVMTAEKHIKWHKVWVEKYGGKPIIDWDKDHYEG